VVKKLKGSLLAAYKVLETTTQIENAVGVMKSNEEAALKGLEREQGMRCCVGTGTDWSYLSDRTQRNGTPGIARRFRTCERQDCERF
jgi:hypothetical protein